MAESDLRMKLTDYKIDCDKEAEKFPVWAENIESCVYSCSTLNGHELKEFMDHHLKRTADDVPQYIPSWQLTSDFALPPPSPMKNATAVAADNVLHSAEKPAADNSATAPRPGITKMIQLSTKALDLDRKVHPILKMCSISSILSIILEKLIDE